jgi:hypothetical protein
VTVEGLNTITKHKTIPMTNREKIDKINRIIGDTGGFNADELGLEFYLNENKKDKVYYYGQYGVFVGNNGNGGSGYAHFFNFPQLDPVIINALYDALLRKIPRNNLELILPLLNFDSDLDFYFLQILKRRKDDATAKVSASVEKDYYIHSKEQLVEMMPKIIERCGTKGRAYLRLNRRNLKKVALQVNFKIANLLMQEDYKAVKRAYASVCGSFSHEPVKRWIVDIDTEELPLTRKIENFIHKLYLDAEAMAHKKGKTWKVRKIMAKIPSKTGLHLICNPFNMKDFKAEFPTVDVKKDNPTNLYIP